MSTRKNKPNKQVIKVNNYVRYYDRSVDNGHNIEIVSNDGSMIEIQMRWPKGEDRLNKPGRAHKNTYK